MESLLELTNYHKRNSDVSFKEGLYTFLNPYSYLLATKNKLLFCNFERIYFDGIALLKLFSLFGLVQSERISFDMTSLAPHIFSYCADEGKTVYFIGSKSTEIRDAVTVFKDKFPRLKVAGFRHGYFENSQEMGCVQQEIYDLNPDFVIAGLGTPLQEQFLVNLRKIGWNGVGFTCGGFFHQTANKGIQYYPDWINRLHLRWFYRMYDEPKLIKRYLIQYPRFFMTFLMDVIRFFWNVKQCQKKS